MIKNNNTYVQDKNFKDLQFSKGESLTELDLEIIESRSTTTYSTDEEYERFLSEEYTSYIAMADLTPEELSYNGADTFTIGNNIAGGI